MNVWIEQGTVWDLIPEAQEGFRMICKLYSIHKKDVFVTSGREGNHIPHSFHYSGRAWDMRRKCVPLKRIKELLAQVPGIWQVISHGSWIHIELDKMP